VGGYGPAFDERQGRATILGLVPLGLLACLLASTASGVASRCAEGCRTLTDSTLRARACAACVIAEDRAAWVTQLGRLGAVDDAALALGLEQALSFPDWRVQRAALEVRALKKGTRFLAELSDYLIGRPAEGCVLAIHVAGDRGDAMGPFTAALTAAGAPGPRAAAILQAHLAEARDALELEIYSEDVTAQREALSHLAKFEGSSPARVLLTAMKKRPAVGDAIALQALAAVSDASGTPLGSAVVRIASPVDEAMVNRLFAVLSTQLDGVRPRLGSADPLERVSAVGEVGRYAPLSAPELRTALGDADGRVRRAAARWLARSENESVSELAARRAKAGDAPGADAWLRALAESADRGCRAAAGGLADDASVEPHIRGAALEALAECEGARAWTRIQQSLGDPEVEIRRGAVGALAWMPLKQEAQRAAVAALADGSPMVVAAAARAAAFPGQRRAIPALMKLLQHEAPEVRSAAAGALGQVGATEASVALGIRLRDEPDPGVRRALIHALASLGSPASLAVLDACSRSDGDAAVREEAEKALQKAGAPAAGSSRVQTSP
jgi:HEAT repeat protein